MSRSLAEPRARAADRVSAPYWPDQPWPIRRTRRGLRDNSQGFGLLVPLACCVHGSQLDVAPRAQAVQQPRLLSP